MPYMYSKIICLLTIATLYYTMCISLDKIFDNYRILVIEETFRLLIEDVDSIYVRL
jgi:hypothetical protein